MNEEAKKIIEEMYGLGNRAENCMSSLQTAFIYNSSKPLKDCYEAVDAVKSKEPELTRKVVELTRGNPDLKPYITVPHHLLKIVENIEKLANSIDKKIKDDVLFSDRAVTETTFLLQRLSEILKPAADIILARNVYLNRYVQESEAGIAKRATDYATLHEERLITGECLPVASSLYINMLNAMKNIAWHAKEIASELAVWVRPKT